MHDTEAARLDALAARVTPERVERIVRELATAQQEADWHIVSLHDVVLRLQAEASDAVAGLEPGAVYTCLSVAATEAAQHVKGMQFLAET